MIYPPYANITFTVIYLKDPPVYMIFHYSYSFNGYFMQYLYMLEGIKHLGDFSL